jgi:hypothetical protein
MKPLNYNILTSLPLEKYGVDLTMMASESEAVIYISNLNIESGVESYFNFIDRLIEKKRRAREGRAHLKALRVSREQISRRLSTSRNLPRYLRQS